KLSRCARKNRRRGQVDGDHVVPCLERKLEEASGRCYTGVIDDDVEASKGIDSHLGKVGDCVEIAHVTDVRDDKLRVRAPNGIQVSFGTTNHKRVNALLRKRQHCGLPETAPTTRNDGDTPLEFKVNHARSL